MTDRAEIPRVKPMHGVLLALRQRGHLVLIRRAKAPYEGYLALPGGKIEQHETPEEAARREMFEETGLKRPKPKWIGRVTDLLVEGEPPHSQFVLDVYEAEIREGAASQSSFEGAVVRVPMKDFQQHAAGILPADVLIIWRLLIERSTTMLDLVSVKTGGGYDVRVV